MFGWWNGQQVANCCRELAAVVISVQRALKKRLITEGEDIIVHTDNTNVQYNLDRKRSGWRMRPMVKDFLRWLRSKAIRLRAVHVKGERNCTADSLSRLSKSGDYSLRAGVLAEIEKQVGVRAQIDLFATTQNAQCRRFATVENVEVDGRTVLARNAMTIPWTGWTALVHPPIPLLPRVLAKIRRNGTTAILVAPYWQGSSWMPIVREMRSSPRIMLGKCEDLLQMSTQMRESRAALPPGMLMTCLLQPR
jgi:hypothetical protein